MRWGVELWDRFEDVSSCVHKGVEFCEKYEEFWKKRCSIENSYAKSLRKLIESYEPKKKELDSERETNSSYLKCFFKMLSEIRDIAGQHELIAENVQDNVLVKLNQLIRILKDERRKCIEDKDRYYAEHLAYNELLEKCRIKYEKAFREVEKAEEQLVKVENDDSASKNDIKKQKAICDQKKRQLDSLEGEYGKQLCEANRIKNLYYYEQLPSVFDTLQNIEKKRIEQFKEYLNECVKIELEVLPRIKQCLNEIEISCKSIDSTQDNNLVVDLLKTGYQIPADHLFQDLKQLKQQQQQQQQQQSQQSNSNLNHTNLSTNSNSSSSSSTTTTTATTQINTLNTNRQKKYRTLNRIKGIFSVTGTLSTVNMSSSTLKSTNDDYSDLPPQQLKNELIKKINQVQIEIDKQQKEREGLLKLKDIYSKNEKFGDSQSAEQALKTNEEKIKNFTKQLTRYQDLFNQLELNLQNSFNSNSNNHVYHQYQSEYSSNSSSSSSSSSATTTLSSTNNNNNNNQKILTQNNNTNIHIYQSPSQTSVNSINSSSIPGTPISIHSNTNTNTNNNSCAYAVSQITTTTSKLAPLVNNNESFDDDDDDDDDDDLDRDQSNLDQQDNNNENNTIDKQVYDQVDTNTLILSAYEHDKIIGTALVMYAFEGNVQNSISIEENESLNVLEKDSGDGWTLVKKLDNQRGYVPTEYIQIVYY